MGEKYSLVARIWSQDAADITFKLLEKDPKNRLGTKFGVHELMSHPWFNGLNWNAIKNR